MDNSNAGSVKFNTKKNKRPQSNDVNGAKKQKVENKQKRPASKKKKEKKPKEDGEKEEPKPVGKVRDFSNDLREYLQMWRTREENGIWKFNKVLQAWALDNLFEKDKIDQVLFKELIPYVLTVKGAALDRLSKATMDIITQKIKEDETDPVAIAARPNLKRDLKIHQYLTGV